MQSFDSHLSARSMLLLRRGVHWTPPKGHRPFGIPMLVNLRCGYYFKNPKKQMCHGTYEINTMALNFSYGIASGSLPQAF